MSEDPALSTAAKGKCSRCGEANAYTSYTCAYCGERLLWADTFAVTAGEPCSACNRFNTYLNTRCSQCEALLPWSEAAAARRARSGDAVSEQKPRAFTIVICLIAVVCLIGYILYSVAR
jgi:hypothetical protein